MFISNTNTTLSSNDKVIVVLVRMSIRNTALATRQTHFIAQFDQPVMLSRTSTSVTTRIHSIREKFEEI